jgi:hypothetical protein
MMETAVAEQSGGNEGAAPLSMVLETMHSSFTDSRFAPPLEFNFRWNGLPIQASVAEENGQGTMEITVDMGAVPYSAEDRERRSYLRELATCQFPIDDCRYSFTEGKKLRFTGRTEIDTPLNGADLTTAVVRFILRAQSYLLLAFERPPEKTG